MKFAKLRRHRYRKTPYARKDGERRNRFTCEFCEDSYSTVGEHELAPGGYCNRYTLKGVIGNLFRPST